MTSSPEWAGPTWDVLVRVADAGPAYVAVTWLDPREPAISYTVAPREVLEPLLRQIQEGLMAPLDGETAEAAAERALVGGLFTDRARVRELGRKLGEMLLPETFWKELDERTSPGRPVRVRITPSRSTAVVPWDLLRDGDGRTLLEAAQIVYEVPSTALHERPRVAPPFDRTAPALYTLDPRLPTRAGLGTALEYDAHEGRAALWDLLGLDGVEREVDRAALSAQLTATPAPGRWLYLGHVSTRHDQPGSASLHLSDTSRDGAVVTGTAELIGGVHRPFTALDLVLGTNDPDAEPAPGERLPGPPGVSGAELWPMPSRVAIIACESGSDHATMETFGLVVAVMANGAQDVTSTRWTMPTDHAFRAYAGVDHDPTSALTVAVDTAHRAEDPVAALQEWQRAQHARWETTGDVRYSPLLYAGVTTHHAHVRPHEAA